MCSTRASPRPTSRLAWRSPDPSQLYHTYNVTIFSGGNRTSTPKRRTPSPWAQYFSPPGLPNFSASIDGSRSISTTPIATVGTNEVARRCQQDQEQLFCDLISFEGTTDAGNYPKMILVGNQFVNVAQSQVEGIDAELAYRRDLTLFGGDEAISTRVFATLLLDRSDVGATGAITRFDGLTGLAPDTGARAVSEFKLNGTSLTANGRSGLLPGPLRVRQAGLPDRERRRRRRHNIADIRFRRCSTSTLA